MSAAQGVGPPSRQLVSAVIACYKDGQAIPIMHERLTSAFAAAGVDGEIIFVNDGSPDESREVLREIAARDPNVVVITHTRPFGSQSAFTSGMRIATGDAVVLLDGDLQDPPELIPEFVERWREGYEVVYGERVDREGRRVMRWAYKRFYRLLRRVSYIDVPVDAGDFGLMDRRTVDVVNALPEKQRLCAGCGRGSASGRSAFPMSARSVCSASARTTSSGTSAGRDVRSSRSPTRRWTSSSRLRCSSSAGP